MICPKCGSTKIHITTEQISSKTSVRGSGCLWSLGRLFLIIFTCGLWLLIGKHNETGKTNFKNQTIGICQDCGYKFNL